MASLADVQNTYRAITRTPLDPEAASAVLRAIELGQTTLASYTSDLIQNAGPTTGAAVAMIAFVTGTAPTSQHLDALKIAADAQIASYRNLGVVNPALGAFEAFGKSLAGDANTGFAEKYGSLSGSEFIVAVYREVYAQAPSAAALGNLLAQIDYFVALYTRNGFSASQAALEAKGAVLGQVIGYAFTDPTAAALATLDDQVATFLSKAASGDTTIFSAPLPAIGGGGGGGSPPPAPLTFALTAGTDTFTGADGADLFQASSGTLNAGDILDGKGGVDILSVSASGETLVGVTLTSIEEIRLVNGGTLAADLNSLGSFAFGHAATTDTGDVTLDIDVSGAANFDVSGVRAGQAGTSASGIKATYTNVATTALNVTLSGLADTFTGTGQADIINAGAGNDTIDGGAGADTIDGGAGDDRIAFATADSDTVDGGSGRDTLVIAGGALTVDLTATTGAITNFEVFDASAATGALVTNVATNPGTTTSFTVVGSALADTITTGAGNDVITTGTAGQTIQFDALDAGGGNDTLVVIGSITTGSITQNRINLNLPDQVSIINNTVESAPQSGFENLDLSQVFCSTGTGFSITAHSGGSTIAGTKFFDIITGGIGDDIILGQYGRDWIYGGGGTNTLVLINGGTAGLFAGTNVQANLVDFLHDSSLTDIQRITVSGSILMTLDLSTQLENFVISADTATAAETIIAGAGADIITGSSLGDILDGGLGADTLTGGAGADTFRFNANGSVAGTSMDVITDFAANSDRLSFSTTAVLQAADATALAAGSNVQQTAGGLVSFAAADNSLALKIAAIQADTELDAANSLAFFVDGGDSYVYFAGNAAGNADDMIVKLAGVSTLTTITAGATSTIA